MPVEMFNTHILHASIATTVPGRPLQVGALLLLVGSTTSCTAGTRVHSLNLVKVVLSCTAKTAPTAHCLVGTVHPFA